MQNTKASKGRNENRPNGKAWKKIWGPSGPPSLIVDTARSQSSASKRKASLKKVGS